MTKINPLLENKTHKLTKPRPRLKKKEKKVIIFNENCSQNVLCGLERFKLQCFNDNLHIFSEIAIYNWNCKAQQMAWHVHSYKLVQFARTHRALYKLSCACRYYIKGYTIHLFSICCSFAVKKMPLAPADCWGFCSKWHTQTKKGVALQPQQLFE